MGTPSFSQRTSRPGGSHHDEAMGPDNAGHVPGGSGAAARGVPSAQNPRAKGGISRMAKKTAKGGAKKKGGKKR